MTSALSDDGPANGDGMVPIPGGRFLMGSDRHYAEEAPVHEVEVAAFWIDVHPVTVGQFARFVSDTGYVTVAERGLLPSRHDRAPTLVATPGSAVFQAPASPVSLSDPMRWWYYYPGADWRHPSGPGSSVRGLEDHPVVHVALEDASSYARWCGKALPTEAEWEYAARGGIAGTEFAWGDTFSPDDRLMANVWLGSFPWDYRRPGTPGTEPAGSYPVNGYGLYDVTGNVWEWTCDLFDLRDEWSPGTSCCAPKPDSDTTERALAERGITDFGRSHRYTLKGGSYLCAANYCARYRPAARIGLTSETSTGHVGFRCVQRDPGARSGQCEDSAG